MLNLLSSSTHEVINRLDERVIRAFSEGEEFDADLNIPRLLRAEDAAEIRVEEVDYGRVEVSVIQGVAE
jgi:hypothetical protein